LRRKSPKLPTWEKANAEAEIVMTINFAGSAFQNSLNRRWIAKFAAISLVILAAASAPALANGLNNGRDRAVGHGPAARSSMSIAPGIGTVGGGRLIFGLAVLRDLVGNIARGGPGEGATPHVSPTSDWKGRVNTNICNFQHICQ